MRVETFPVLLTIELTLHCQMCDLHFKFEEDRTKIAVAIESARYFGQTDRQTDRQTLQWFYVYPVCFRQTII